MDDAGRRHRAGKGDPGNDSAAALWLRRLIQTSFAAEDPFESLAADLVDDPATAGALAAEIEALLRQSLNGKADLVAKDVIAVLLDAGGRVLSASQAARRAFGIGTNSGIAALGLSLTEFEDLKARLLSGGGATLLPLRPLAGNLADDDILMLAEVAVGTDQIQLREATVQWPERLDTLLAELYQLTQSERDIARDLLAGLDPGRIAQRRGSALGTVRQQIKSIQSKTRCHTQLRLQALLAQAAFALNDAAPRHSDPDAARTRSLSMKHDDPRRFGAVSGGAPTGIVGLRSFGDPNGLPCLLFHGCLFGFGELSSERQAATVLGLHLFGPERPGYGQTAALQPAAPWQDHAEVVTQDALAAMDAFGVRRAVLLAQDTGLLPALAFAAAHPERVVAVICISPTPPVLAWAQSEGMPPQQRIFALAMLRMPGLAPTLVQMGLARMRKIGAHAWPQAVFAGVPVDEAVAAQPANLAAVTRAYMFNSAHGAVGFQVDLHNQYRDWTALAASLRVPVRVLHGTQNKTTTPLHARSFMSAVPDCNFSLVDGAGHTLALSHYGLVLRAVLQAWFAEGVVG